jgi:hypothetical protein
VYDEHGLVSSWKKFGNTGLFKILNHPGPDPDFTINPDGLNVNFISTSICYDNSDSDYCSNYSNISYSWWFDNASYGDAQESVNRTFEEGEHTATLQVCDEHIKCCSITYSFTVENESGADSPKWKEISPF